MFSQKIVGSDAFIEMPVSARELYFQLGMYSDDDGFINPKKIIRMLGASDDDLKILIGKRFVLQFENGVVVIKHWKINNLIRKDFYEETIYVEQKKQLTLKENKAYTDNVNNLLTQYSIDKVSIDKINTERVVKTTPQNLHIDSSIIEKLKQKGFPTELVDLEIKKFISYWTETNQRGKQRWQGQKFFDVSRRLATWFSRIATDYNKNQPKTINLDNL